MQDMHLWLSILLSASYLFVFVYFRHLAMPQPQFESIFLPSSSLPTQRQHQGYPCCLPLSPSLVGLSYPTLPSQCIVGSLLALGLEG